MSPLKATGFIVALKMEKKIPKIVWPAKKVNEFPQVV